MQLPVEEIPFLGDLQVTGRHVVLARTEGVDTAVPVGDRGPPQLEVQNGKELVEALHCPDEAESLTQVAFRLFERLRWQGVVWRDDPAQHSSLQVVRDVA